METGKEQLRYISALMILILCALLLTARLIYLYVADPQRFPINTVKITGTYQHISHQQLEEVLDQYLTSSFFSLPVNHLHRDLSVLPWVKRVQIERVWPDTLKINLVEKIPVAVWNNAMLSSDGEVFNERGELTDNSLPHLKGPVNHQQQVLHVYEKMSKILSMCGLHADSLEWRENEAWELTLSNGILLRLGKRDLEERVGRFCKAYPAVFADKQQQLTSVDLRYSRGMAIQWKN